jgi:hypothetical protein
MLEKLSVAYSGLALDMYFGSMKKFIEEQDVV